MARNTTTASRSAESREMNTRDEEYTYREPSLLDIPEAVNHRFADQGLKLRWIRMTIRGQEDYNNIGKKMSEGWEFVSIDEVPEMQHSSIVKDDGRYTGTVCRGDLALAKMPIKKAESRQRYFEDQSREMVDAVNAQLMNQSDARMPIRNNSKTQVTKGRTPKFQD